MKTEHYYLLALQNVKGIGSINAKKLLKYCGSAQAIFEEKTSLLNKIEGIGAYVLKNLKNKTIFDGIETELEFIAKYNIKTYSLFDQDYPELLKHTVDSPLLLFSSGNIDLKNPKIISIVGTRKITTSGREFCQQLVADLAPYNPLIISGFAYGVDICAHKAAVKHNLQTIGVLAHGLNQTYPKVHKKYVADIEKNGGFITEFKSSSSPERENFLQRNRIIAGMSQATIVVESASKGGSLVTAEIANSYNRDVFAVPGKPTDMFSEGCNNLIKYNKASLLTSAEDIVRMLQWETQKPKKVIQRQLFINFNTDEQKIVDYLSKNGKTHIDTIAIETQLLNYKVAQILLQLELKGVIKPIPGKMFDLV